MVPTLCKILAVFFVFRCTCGDSDSKHNVVFLIDDTSSMGPVIKQVIQKADQMFQAIYASRTSATGDFILITFNDYEVYDGIKVYEDFSLRPIQVRAITSDRDLFSKKLNEISVYGGGYCPELCLTGIQVAIEKCAPNSYIYVFTDASARDFYLQETIQNLAQQKSIKITFLLVVDGMCPVDMGVFKNIAAATFGQVFQLKENDINDIINYIIHCMTNPQTDVKTVHITPGVTNTNFTADNDMKNIAIVANVGPKKTVTVDVIGPDGNPVSTTNLVKTPNTKVIIINKPENGSYAVTVDSDGSGEAGIKATISLHFRHGFSTWSPSSMKNTKTRPVPNVPSYLVIQLLLTGTTDAVLNVIQILDMDDKELINMSASVLNEKENIYVSPQFKPPNHVFKIAIIAVDQASNEEIKRIGRTPIQPQALPAKNLPYKKPEVTIENSPKINTNYGESITLECKVNAYPQPNIVWEDEDTGLQLPSEVYISEFPYDYMSHLVIKNVTKNGSYKCKATSSSNEVITSLIEIETTRLRFLKVLESPKDTTIDYEKDAEVYCKIDAWPLANVAWYKDDIQLTNDGNFDISDVKGTLLIKNMQPELKGLYSCRATNEDNSLRLNFTVGLSGIESPEFDKTNSATTVDEGSNALISCRIVKGKPLPNITWKFKKFDANDFIRLPSTQEEIQINSAAVDNDGIYKCHAKNFVGEDHHEISLTVQYAPVIDKSETTVIATKGTKAVISCRIIKGKPLPNITWKFKKFDANDFIRLPSTQQEIELNPAEVDNDGIYKCHAKNSVGEDHHEISLTVQYGPVIDKSEPTVIATKGTKAVISCRIIKGKPLPNITWKFKKFDANDFISLPSTQQEIELNPVGVDNDGTYKCHAKNSVGEDHHEISLTVQYAPVIDKSEPTVIATKGTKAVISCRIIEGLPEPKISWEFKRQKATEFISLTETGPEIQLDPVEHDSSGVYKCYAKNVVGKDSHEVDFTVHDGPTVRVSKSLKAKIGETVTLSCEVTGIPKPDVTWYKDDITIATNGKHTIYGDNSLRFVAEINDGSNYTCYAKNNLGEHSDSAVLEVYAPVHIEPPDEYLLDVDVGDDVEMLCKASGIPTPQIIWQFYSTDPSIGSKNFSLGQEVLTINKIQSNSAGFYRCIANNIYDEQVIAYQVVVNVPVEIETPQQSKLIIVENDFVLRIPCKAKGYPKPTVSWMKNFIILTMDDPYEMDANDTLIIKNPTSSAKGDYVCVASNDKTTAYELYSVNFTRTPMPSAPTETIYIEKGKSTEIKCKLPQKSTDKVRWYRDKVEIPLPTNRFMLNDPIASDSGIYSCRVSSLQGSESAHVELVIGSKPSFKYQNGTEIIVSFIRGTTCFLDCHVDGIPTPTITWWQKEVKLGDSDYYYKIEDVNESHLGKFRCEAKNDFGTITRSFEFKIIGCQVNYTEKEVNKFHPVLLSQWGKLVEFPNEKGVMTIPEAFPLDVLCTNEIRKVYCSNNEYYFVNTPTPGDIGHLKYADLKCNSQVEPSTRQFGTEPCTAVRESKLIQVGYEHKGSFCGVYDVCFNQRTQKQYFIKYDVSRYASNIKIGDYPFNDQYMYYDYKDMFDCSKTSNIYGDGCCYVGKQLVGPEDVTPGIQKITYFNMNVVPQWNFCNFDFNVREIQTRIKKLAKAIRYKVQVYSGEFRTQNIFLDDKNGNRKVVPKYIWKVVYIQQIGQALAIITLNIPNISETEARKLVFCEDICDKTDWMKNRDWHFVLTGYTFCCRPWEFAEKANPTFKILFGQKVLLSKNIN